MGAAESFINGSKDHTCSDQCIDFCDCFAGAAVRDPPGTKRGKGPGSAMRAQAWMVADPNGNGLCSLAEIDGWIQKTLMHEHGDDVGKDIWRKFRPSYIRAFNDAKDIGKDRKVFKNSDTSADDYVQKGEFRLLNAYLCIYAVMFDAFSRIDGDSEGTTATDDRRMGIEEWKKGFSAISGHGFACFANVGDDASSLEAIFKKMDADGKGMVLLREFCEYIEKGEEEAGTEVGKMLGIGDGDQAR